MKKKAKEPAYVHKSFRVTEAKGRRINRAWRKTDAKSFSHWVIDLINKELKNGSTK
jgi:hypothetical protein